MTPPCWVTAFPSRVRRGRVPGHDRPERGQRRTEQGKGRRERHWRFFAQMAGWRPDQECTRRQSLNPNRKPSADGVVSGHCRQQAAVLAG